MKTLQVINSYKQGKAKRKEKIKKKKEKKGKNQITYSQRS